MPVRLTRQVIEVLGINPGVVEPAFLVSDLATYYPPFLEPDWASRIEVETSWETAISVSPYTGTEERHSLKSRPSRKISATSTSMSQAGSMQHQSSFFQMMNARSPFPIYPDVTTLTRSVGPATATLDCDTSHRRFYNGQRIAVTKRDFTRITDTPSGIQVYALYGYIKEVALDRIELEDALGTALDGSELVFPCIDSHPLLNQDGSLFSDFYSQSRVSAFEIDGASTLPATWSGDISAYFDYQAGYPIFKIEPNYSTRVKQGYYRPGKRFRSGRSSQIQLYAEFPSIKIDYSELNLSRQEAWDLLRFFDSRKGATYPFWAIQPLTTWKYVSATNTQVQVVDFDYKDVQEKYLKHVGIEGTDGKLYVRAIDEIGEAAGRLILKFNSDPLTVVPDIRRVAPAWLCRFDEDSIAQLWETDRYENSNLKIIGLQNEQEALLQTL